MSDINFNEVVINGKTYVEKDCVLSQAKDTNGLPYCIVRTYSAGVFAGFLKERSGKEGTLLYARRIYYWSGAASLSELSQQGVSKPKECKFPQEVPSVLLTEIIEILPVSEKAKNSIKSVPIWSV